MKARRAIVDDLPQLIALWELEQLPVAELEKRFTEFQVVVEETKVLGAIGIRIHENHGHLHSEAIGTPEAADAIRALLWDRAQMVARNHAVDRYWSRLQGAFWRERGFRPATEEELERIPLGFGEPTPGWNLLFLRGEEGTADAIEKQFAMLRALHSAESEKIQRRASTLKKMALLLTVLVAFLVIAFAVVVFRYGPQFLRR